MGFDSDFGKSRISDPDSELALLSVVLFLGASAASKEPELKLHSHEKDLKHKSIRPARLHTVADLTMTHLAGFVLHCCCFVPP